MLKTAIKLSKIKSFRPSARQRPKPKAAEDKIISVKRYRYRIIETSIANGAVRGVSELEAKRAVREAIEADGSVIFDSQTIEIQLIPICIACEKDSRSEDVEPYGLCRTCDVIKPLEELEIPESFLKM